LLPVPLAILSLLLQPLLRLLMATLEIFQPTEPFLEHSILGHDRPLPYQRLVRTVYPSNKAVFVVE